MLSVMNSNGTPELQVYVKAGCAQCERATKLAQEVESDYAQLAVRVIDMADASASADDVFAVPTFILNGKVISLGNPGRNDLRREIESLLRDHGSM